MEWSSKRLSEQTGIPQSQISKMLKGDRPIETIDAWRFARVLALTEAYILYGDRRFLSQEVIDTLPPDL